MLYIEKADASKKVIGYKGTFSGSGSWAGEVSPGTKEEVIERLNRQLHKDNDNGYVTPIYEGE